jgi:hypothetical protein
MGEKLTLRYDDEFIKEAASLPDSVQEVLYGFLERLAENPDSPELEAEPCSRGLWGSQFTSGYCLYWKVEREQRFLTTLSAGRPKLIAVKRIKEKPIVGPQRKAKVKS